MKIAVVGLGGVGGFVGGSLRDGLRRRGFAEKDVADIAGLGLIHYFERIKV